MAVETLGFSKERFLFDFQGLFRYYEREDRLGSMFQHESRRGKIDSQRRALEKVLYASSLNSLNVSDVDSLEIVEIAFEISPQAFYLWWNDFKTPLPFSNDHTDVRVRTIIKFAEEKFRQEGMIR